jgi:hypothetical protein
MVDDTTSVSWGQCTKFHPAGWMCRFFYILLFGAWCDFHDRSDKGAAPLCKSREKGVTETLAMIRQAFREESMSQTRKIQTHWDRKDEEQSQEHDHNFLLHYGDCSLRICPGRPNSQFRTLLWCFTENAWKCGNTLLWILETKELAVASWQYTVSHFLFHCGFFYQKQHSYHPPPTLLFSICLLEDKTEGLPIWYKEHLVKEITVIRDAI